jgi:hypothetical protein
MKSSCRQGNPENLIGAMIRNPMYIDQKTVGAVPLCLPYHSHVDTLTTSIREILASSGVPR